MTTLFLSLFLAIFHPTMPKDLTIADVADLIGKIYSENSLLSTPNITRVSEDQKFDYLPFEIDLGTNDPGQFLFLGIEVEEFYLKIDSANRITAIYITINNKDVVQKLTNVMGKYASATGSSFGDDVSLSAYAWDYNGTCVDLQLNAYKLLQEDGGERNNARVIFNNCDMKSFLGGSSE
jgi:hypothetical protein